MFGIVKLQKPSMSTLPKGFRDIRLFQIVQRTIDTYGMFNKDDRVLVGVSGGPDSMALLHVLSILAPRLALHLAVAHFDHGLREPDAQRDAAFVRHAAQQRDLPFYCQREDVNVFQQQRRLSLEEACRLRRYAFYDRLRQREGFDKIALGHQADDNAELVLMNLLRGSGPEGLAGIPPMRDNLYVRPLIGVSRRQIMQFITQQKIAYVEDASNTDLAFTRNQIRHVLMPLLEQDYNPRMRETLNRTADILQQEEQWLREIVADYFGHVVRQQRPGQLVYAIPRLRQLHPALQRRLLRHGIRLLKGDLRRISHKHMTLLEELTYQRESAAHLDLPDGIQVLRNGATLTIADRSAPLAKRLAAAPPVWHYLLEAPDDHSRTVQLTPPKQQLRYGMIPVAAMPPGGVTGQNTAFFDMDKLHFPLVLRPILPGDRFQPLGLQGSQKVSKFLINSKFPQPGRKDCLVLLSAQKIVWLVGHRIAEQAKITPQTQHVLKLELLLA